MVRAEIQKNRNQLCANGFTIEEEAEFYEEMLEDVIRRPRYYLDQLQYLQEVRVIWKDYRYNNPTMPHKYTLKQKNR